MDDAARLLERLRRIESLGALLVIAGAIVVTYRPDGWHADLVGAIAIAGACFSWALDNNLTRETTTSLARFRSAILFRSCKSRYCRRESAMSP